MIPTQRIRKTALWLGMIFPLAVLLSSIWIAHKTNGQFNTAFLSVTHTYRVLNLLVTTQSHVGDAETGRRGYLLTGREDYRTLYGIAVTSVTNDINQLRILAGDDPEQSANLDRLQALVGEQLSARRMDPRGLTSDKLAVVLTDEGRDTMKRFRELLFSMQQQELDSLGVRQQEAENRLLFDQAAFFILIGVTAIALIAILAVLIRLEHLRQIVTVCAWTGQVKHEGEWIRLEDYLKLRFGLSVSHGLSQEAAEKMAQEMRQAKAAKAAPPAR